MRLLHVMLAILLASAGAVPGAGQAQEFEVASIRRNVSQQLGGTTIQYPRGGFRATKVTVHDLLRVAYAVRDDQLLGAPEWVRTERFDIDARAATEVTREQTLFMVQSLLKRRFGLSIRKESQVRDVYVLAVARRDGRLGADLRRSAESCSERPTTPAEIAARMPKPSSGGRASFAGSCERIDAIARAVERRLLTTVIDDTELTGFWDYAVAHGSLDPAGGLDAGDAPSLFVALQEQLDLKLERSRRPVEVIVIVSIHPPTDN